jgi:CubicO group peptidase (beta-lactamase class C family)
MRRPLIALLLAAAACASYHEQGRAARDIDRFAATVLREVPDLPAVGVAVVMNGRTVYLRDAQTAYYIGSTTKAYTGLACAILAQRGLIDLDAPVSRYLPETKLAVPLRAFLTHTSGVQNGGIVYRTAYTGEHTQAQLVSLLDQSTPIKPGFRYDNLGYVVASLVIERVTGKPWQKALDELVFEPLGMTHTTAYMSEAKRWPMAKPFYRDRSGAVVPLAFEKNDQTMHAAGGIVTTPADLARWLQANLTRSNRAIPAAAFELAQKNAVPTTLDRGDFKGTGYAFGWWHGDFHGEHAMFHGGGYEGWHSWYALLPEKQIGAAVLTNVNATPDDAADLIVSYAFDRLLGKPDLEAEYAKRLTAVKERVAKMRQALIDEVAQRALRPWSLPHPNEAYAGRYDNPMYGTLVIEERGGKLYASIGQLSSLIEAYTKPETARVELTPGSGEALVFKWGSGDKPDAVVWGGDTFVRVP